MVAATTIPRVDILGVGVHALNMQLAVDALDQAVEAGEKGYVAVTGVHGIVHAQDDDRFKQILNRSFLTTPDGMPTVWIGRGRGHTEMSRVYGPELMLRVCEESVAKGYTHFLYGGEAGVADHLADTLVARFPGLRIVGTFTPPFRPLNEEEETRLGAELSELQPDFLWVGLSTPKQELFMAEYSKRLSTTMMLGVGAAFDILTGRVKDAPSWIKPLGLQWFHRFCQEPRRLWKRYLFNNPRFIYLLAREKMDRSP